MCEHIIGKSQNWERALHILFVCTGNICRSPTAERLAVAYASQFRVPDFTASSAGTHAVIAHGVHHEAARALEKLGGDASNFVARQFTSRTASGADLIITMTKAHRDAVLEAAPQKLHRTFTLPEAAGLVTECGAKTVADLAALRPRFPPQEIMDILDPIGQSADVFTSVGVQIANLLPPLLELCRRSSAATG